MKVVQVSRTGGPEVLEWVDAPEPAPGPGEVLVRHEAVGVNFVDVYFRSGLYPVEGGLPYVPGGEGAGTIEALGADVTGLKLGDRVVYQAWGGAYAEKRLMPADRLVALPDDIDARTATATFLKGLTAHFLLHRTFKVERGTKILVHAAAGGVGTLLCGWAKALGATVIGTVGSSNKVATARAHGCDHVIDTAAEDFVARVKEITAGGGVDVAYDGVGKDTFPGSLDCIRPMGMWVAFGQSSGTPPPFNINLLQAKGSLFATRPTLRHYVAKRADLEAGASALFDAIRRGIIRPEIGQEFALKDVAKAHRALEARKTVGATILIP